MAFDHYGVPSIASADERGDVVFARQVAGAGWQNTTLDFDVGAMGASLAFDRREMPADAYGANDGLHLQRFVPGSGFVNELLDNSVASGFSWTNGTSVAFDLLGSPAVAAGAEFGGENSVRYISDSNGDGALTSADLLQLAGGSESRPTLTFDNLNRPVIGCSYFSDGTEPNGDADVLVRDAFLQFFSIGIQGNAEPGLTDERNVSVAIDPDDGLPAVAWTNPEDRQLWYAKWDPLNNLWDSDLVDTAPLGAELGNESLAFDPGDGHPAISYSDNRGRVNFAWNNGTTWNRQLIQNTGFMTYSRTSLAFNEFGHGFPAIAYIADDPAAANDLLWFTVDPPAAVPEPVTSVLLMGVAAGLVQLGRFRVSKRAIR
jgi:hypothetical protein